MIETMILGFLTEGPQHGYELRRKMSQLHGYARPISDGTIYPAINRLIKTCAVTESLQPGTSGAPRRCLRLTEVGRERLVSRLRNAKGHDITDPSRFFIILAFLSLVPDKPDRDAVLTRRLEYLETPVSFFSEGTRPLKVSEITDPYRQGILLSAIASNKAERGWLRKQLSTAQQ